VSTSLHLLFYIVKHSPLHVASSGNRIYRTLFTVQYAETTCSLARLPDDLHSLELFVAIDYDITLVGTERMKLTTTTALKDAVCGATVVLRLRASLNFPLNSLGSTAATTLCPIPNVLVFAPEGEGEGEPSIRRSSRQFSRCPGVPVWLARLTAEVGILWSTPYIEKEREREIGRRQPMADDEFKLQTPFARRRAAIASIPVFFSTTALVPYHTRLASRRFTDTTETRSLRGEDGRPVGAPPQEGRAQLWSWHGRAAMCVVSVCWAGLHHVMVTNAGG